MVDLFFNKIKYMTMERKQLCLRLFILLMSGIVWRKLIVALSEHCLRNKARVIVFVAE